MIEAITKFWNTTGRWYPFARMAIILGITYLIVTLYRKISKRFLRRRDTVYRRFFHNTITVLISLIGVVSAFRQFEQFDSVFKALLAGSGVVALAVSLAAQESLANAINGVFISIFKPFEIGDRVHLIGGNITGIIEDITLRHTIVKTYTNSRIIIPNTTINKDMIENSNFQNNKVSSHVDVTIAYDADIEMAQEIMADIIGSHPLYLDNRGPENMDDPKVQVFIRDLTLQGPSLRASMWSRNVDENFTACSDARQQIVTRFAEADIRISTNIAVPPLDPEEEKKKNAL